MMRYYSLNEHCRNTFGHKLYKLSLDGGMTCPNRDGTIGTGGCIFCSDEGSGEFSAKLCGNINAQIENAKQRVAHKNKDGKYIAYFQSFTNTYAPVPYLERIFTEAINHPDVEVLSIATRPDCLGEDILTLLKKINSIKPVWVELGFQTSNRQTASYIGRGYENEVFESAVRQLNAIGIDVIAHVIIGLPGETYEDMKNSVEYVCNCGIRGIKLHLLHVLSGSRLAEEYKNGKFQCLDMEKYLDIICCLLTVIPENVVIHRLTGDGDKRKLIAPLWSGNKKHVLNTLARRMEEKNIIQGKIL